MKNQTHILLSRWRHFWNYLFAFILTPIAGIGLLLFWRLEKRRKAHAFVAEKDRIRLPDPDSLGAERVIDLLVIQKIEVNPSTVPGKWFGVGSLTFHVGSGEIKLDGIRHANRLKETIEQAIQHLKASQKSSKTKQVKSETIPGSTDQLNELTFLWQQGLITDDQFEKEKKNFK